MPLNFTFVTNFVFTPPNSTAWMPPTGSTTCAVTVPATGFPPLVAVIDHGQRTFTFGACLVA